MTGRGLTGAVIALGVLAAGCDRAGGPARQADAPIEPSTEFLAVRPEPSALGAPADASTRAFYEGDFEAVGAEPDWELTVLGEVASFRRTGLEDVVGFPGPREIRQQGALIVAEPLTIILRGGACQHEAGEIYPYEATVQFDGVAYEGCARRAAEGGGASPDWSAVLGQLLPAVDACLARVPAQAQPGRVTLAYLLDGGQANVRLLDAQGGRYECGAPAAGGAVATFEPIGDRNVIAGEREPLFTRAPSPPPEGRCLESAPASGADGGQIGWLTRKVC